MYKKLAIALTINAVVMYLVGYVMINQFGDFYLNINRVYMTLMMVTPMVIVMLLVMSSMFENKKLNLALIAASAFVFILCFALTRTQQPVGNSQFLRSMIPHHSSAIVMCSEAELTDPEIIKLCGQIIESQQKEINQMKSMLAQGK